MKKHIELEGCDNPNCDYEEEVNRDDPAATGYHFMRGYYVLAGGGPIPPFYAHSEDCIVPAMRAVMDEQDKHNPKKKPAKR